MPDEQPYRVEVVFEVFRSGDVDGDDEVPTRGLCSLTVDLDVTAANAALALYQATLPQLGQRVADELELPHSVRVAVLAGHAHQAMSDMLEQARTPPAEAAQ